MANHIAPGREDPATCPTHIEPLQMDTFYMILESLVGSEDFRAKLAGVLATCNGVFNIGENM